MLDVIIGRHAWNCQIRQHMNTGYTHTGTHTKTIKKVERLEKEKKVGNKNMGLGKRKKRKDEKKRVEKKEEK